ncbi:MAG: glycoside hydrolase family 88 protein [Chitinophagaceae bacterium]|nr:glycoside hydrolase family 88 protein [Chitinophagaceae bacterium]
MLLFMLVATMPAIGQRKTGKKDPALVAMIRKNFKDAAAQYKVLAQNLPAEKFPKTYFPTTGKYEFSNSGWWCSGFYPSSLLTIYNQTKDQALYTEALRIMKVLEKEQFNTHTHDLGFMMFLPFNAAKQIKADTAYRTILVNSAKSLSTRFNPTVGCIKSWDGKPTEFLVIIDNMMNLDLLFWATRETGDSSFYKVAVTHANTTIKNHFRPDNSSYHVINYNSETGGINQKRTAQGAADESAWSRGQVWGLYGYTAAYRETKNQVYLDQANKIATFVIEHPNLPADKIPYWDFNATDIPNTLRDASAASIMASALIELSSYVDVATARKYMQVVETILKNLSSPAYKAKPGTNGGFMIQHGVGHKPAGTEIDVPLTYGDYYFLEAMERYLKY